MKLLKYQFLACYMYGLVDDVSCCLRVGSRYSRLRHKSPSHPVSEEKR